ncbi:MAG: DNA methyltransferase [Ferruginibacter sp.]
MNDYLEFLESKKKAHVHTGFKAEINYECLFQFQNYVVQKSLIAGKYGIFSGTGTGKTRMELVWAKEVNEYTKKPVLILCPLAVAGQTILEGEKVNIKIIKASFDIDNPHYAPIQIANYDQLDNIDCSIFGGIALDEASILKNNEGVYRNKIIDIFSSIQFKSVFTATPSPNDPMEIGNYSEFLDVMPRNEMLAMYFIHDAGETQKWRLKGHSVKIFWEWVSTWSVMFQNPYDIGFEQIGYDLPPLELIEKKIVTEKRDNGLLFNDVAVSATNFNSELRLTKVKRIKEVTYVVNNSKEPFIIWVKQNEEGELLCKLIPDAVEVKGSDSIEWKEDKLLGFAKGDFRVLITKTKIAGMGLNYQHCHNQIFASPDFSFEFVFQGIRRSWRFGQKETVNVWIITTDTMTNVIQTLHRKQKQFDEMQSQMTKATNRKLLKKTKMKREFKEVIGDNFTYQLGDCVQLIKNIPDESIGFSIFSPPFSDLYCYSDELEDMGNSKNYKEFMIAFKFLAKELYRVLWSGRNIAIHCMDLPIQKGKEGFIGLRDFSGMIRQAFEDVGFIYASRVTIWKNPVTEMQRTKALGLLHKQVKKDSTMSRVGIPDYLLIFRKDGERNNPVHCKISVDTWQKYASPVWMDIDYGNTLNGIKGRAENDEKHIAPLQLDTIERAVTLYTNEGDTVLTPFAGIGSELYQSLKMNRKAIGFELKESYFNIGVENCKSVELQKCQLSLI